MHIIDVIIQNHQERKKIIILLKPYIKN